MEMNSKWGGGGRVKFCQLPLPLRQVVSWLIHDSVPLQIHNVIKDKAGRYLIIQGRILREQFILINIYAPNTDQPTFFHNLFLTIASLSGACIMAGDFNCTLDPRKDKSIGVDQSHLRSRGVIHHFMKEISLIDVWREDNPNGEKYTPVTPSHRLLLSFNNTKM